MMDGWLHTFRWPLTPVRIVYLLEHAYCDLAFTSSFFYIFQLLAKNTALFIPFLAYHIALFRLILSFGARERIVSGCADLRLSLFYLAVQLLLRTRNKQHYLVRTGAEIGFRVWDRSIIGWAVGTIWECK